MAQPKTIQSLNRAMDILEVLSFGAVTLTELSKSLRLHKATTFQLVSTLRSRGYVAQDKASKKYSLGLKVAELNEALWHKDSFKRNARPHLIRLTEITGETSHLATYQNSDIFIIDVEIGTGILVARSYVGDEPLAHSSAVGKAILAHLGEEKVEQYCAAELARFTPKTITGKDRLKKELACVRQAGYAVDDEETNIGVICIACAVFNRDGNLQGSIGISGPTARITAALRKKLVQEVKEVGEQLSGELGYRTGT